MPNYLEIHPKMHKSWSGKTLTDGWMEASTHAQTNTTTNIVMAMSHSPQVGSRMKSVIQFFLCSHSASIFFIFMQFFRNKLLISLDSVSCDLHQRHTCHYFLRQIWDNGLEFPGQISPCLFNLNQSYKIVKKI